MNLLRTFPDLPVMTWACLVSSVRLTTWLGDSIESVNHLLTANQYNPHI